jgi:hypothetical protein
MNQSLHTRLRSLRIEPPEDLAARALARRRQASGPYRSASRRSLRIAIAVAAMALAFASNLPAAYLFPRYGEALANAQVIGAVSRPVLRAAGLAEAQLTAADEVAVSGTHSLHLIAAYADTYRTVLLVEVDGQPMQLDRKPLPPPTGLAIAELRLTDQFGHVYQDSRPSPFSPLEFGPLAGLAGAQGARLTLHVTRLERTAIGSVRPSAVIDGDWTLRATVFQQPSRVLAVPVPGSIDDTRYTVTYVHLSSSLLQLRVRVTGSAVKKWDALRPPGPQADAAAQRAFGERLGHLVSTYYSAVLVSPDGTQPEMRSGDFGGDQINSSYIITSPGTYHLRIGSPATGVYDAPIIVPAR